MNHPVKYEPKRISLSKLFNYFLKGLLLLAPISITLYIIIIALNWLDGLIPAIEIPGLGLAIIISAITLVGYITSAFVSKSVFDYFEKWISKVPFISLIYTSLKDLTDAFVGEKKKFNKPVLVTVDTTSTVQRLGFITQEDLTNLGLTDKVAVYLPHSFNFSGNFCIVPRSNVTLLHVPRTHFMKFIVSGGVTAIPGNAADRKSENDGI